MIEDSLKEKLLFNPNAREDLKVFNGETSNILDLTNIPKDSEVFHKLVDTMYANNWLPHKVSMADDDSDYKNKLTDDDRNGYDMVISFLAFLDSLQTNNLPNISNYVTNPHIVYALARQTWDEALHSKSYGWIFSSIMSKEKASHLYNLWKTSPILLERNKWIASIYQEFINKPNLRNFIRALIANYLLEGVYFYNGFQLFHTFANRGLCIGSNTQISYIKRDELVHTVIFEHIIKLGFKETKGLQKQVEQMVYDMFKEAVQWEIAFSNEAIGNKILGMSETSIKDNAHYLANKRLEKIGYDKIFDDVKNPYTHLDKISGVEDETSNRTNNFEATSISYKSPEILNGWDNL
jgi:ribonucleoside-diphosphate reductase beta chain